MFTDKLLFNPFADLYRRHRGEFQPTLREKIIDASWVIFGIVSKRHDKIRIGIFDYLTLGIPFLICFLMIALETKLQNRVTRILAIIIVLPFMAFRALITGILTLMAMPVIVFIHFLPRSR
ncbi:MAG: hypothetical protein H0U57_02885 [Tatlockia sp.]|nr:hypothetical protein [Tatlockia sp.]